MNLFKPNPIKPSFRCCEALGTSLKILNLSNVRLAELTGWRNILFKRWQVWKGDFARIRKNLWEQGRFCENEDVFVEIR